MLDLSRVVESVDAERAFQDKKWGTEPIDGSILPSRHLHAQNSVLFEEVGEVATATLNGDGKARLRELIQVAAVAIAIIQFHYTDAEVDAMTQSIIVETATM